MPEDRINALLSRRSFTLGMLLGAGSLASTATGCAYSSKATAHGAASDRISLPGSYRGYATPQADGFIRSSEYVSVSDGTKIAVDIFLPTLNGQVLATQLSTIAMFTGYRRSWLMGENESQIVKRRWPDAKPGEFVSFGLQAARMPDGRTAQWHGFPDTGSPEALATSLLANGCSDLEYLIVHGYAAIVADTRATGASFGTPEQQNAIQIGKDISDVFEKLSQKPWSNGKFGMLGGSWLGAVQHMAATYGAKHLKAVMPQVAPYDQYLNLWPGGIFNLGLMQDWLAQTVAQDSTGPALPVDEDLGGALRDEAIASRKPVAGAGELDPKALVDAQIAAMAFLPRDYFYAGTAGKEFEFADGTRGTIGTTPLDFEHANRNAIPVYEVGGWWDIYADETPISFLNLKGPRKLLMGPWNHGNDWVPVEALRWFDFWLRGVPNGIMDEPEITFGATSSSGDLEWYGLNEAMLDALDKRAWSLGEDGRLSSTAVQESELHLDVDFSVTPGPGARPWGFSLADRLDYSGLVNGEAGRMFHSSAPLGQAALVCGYPSLTLSIASSDDRAELFVYLCVIDRQKKAWVISSGQLDLQYREEGTPPIENFGLPWRHYNSHQRKPLIPGEFYRIRLAMTPICWQLKQEDRLGLIFTGADKFNAFQAEPDHSRTLSCRLGGDEGAGLILPLAGQSGLKPVAGAFQSLPQRSKSAIASFQWPRSI